MLLALLAGPPTWRALAAARGLGSYMSAIGGEGRAGAAVRLGSRSGVSSSSFAWRLADVLSAALLCVVWLLRTVGPTLMASEAGKALHRFAGVGRIEWHAAWAPGAWLLLAAAACDVLCRVAMWLAGKY